MQEQDAIRRILDLCQARGWTVYRLSKESGIPYSTLCTMLHKANAPSLPTLIKLCEGFGISMAQFFDVQDPLVYLTEEDKHHLQLWGRLSEENRRTAEKYMVYLLSQQ